jgi:uncharacterized protein
MLVLDTGVVLASLDRSEPRHVDCRQLIDRTDDRVVVPAPILCELDHLIHTRLGPLAMPRFLRRVRHGELEMEQLELADLDRTIELMERYADLDVGFVDAAVLAIVERLNEPKLATLDRKHFGAMRARHVDALQLLPA